MQPLELAAWSFPLMLLLIFLRVPIGLSMLAVGLTGSWLVYGSAMPLLNQMKTLAYTQFSNHSLSIVPAVPADGAVRFAGRHFAGALQGGPGLSRAP